MATRTATTPLQRTVLFAIALTESDGADAALANLIEEGVLDANHHINSPEFKDARDEALRA